MLAGDRETTGRTLPILIVENIKSNRDALIAVLESHGYRHFFAGMNILGVHPSDGTLAHIKN